MGGPLLGVIAWLLLLYLQVLVVALSSLSVFTVVFLVFWNQIFFSQSFLICLFPLVSQALSVSVSSPISLQATVFLCPLRPDHIASALASTLCPEYSIAFVNLLRIAAFMESSCSFTCVPSYHSTSLHPTILCPTKLFPC